MTIKIPPENLTQPNAPKNQKGQLMILMDCALPIKNGSKQLHYYKEGDIVEYYKIYKKRVKSCCGIHNNYAYYYVIVDTNILLPVTIAKEL
jgi:hypothetical protein